jgi:hypothetical protein
VSAPVVTKRGTSNSNQRGSAAERRRRKQWLVETYRADVDLLVLHFDNGHVTEPDHYVLDPEYIRGHEHVIEVEIVSACRCYRCGKLLTVETVTVDRIIPGCQGGTYRRENIRPACGFCNSSTGGRTRRKR